MRQEIDRLNTVITLTTTTLKDLRLAIAGKSSDGLLVLLLTASGDKSQMLHRLQAQSHSQPTWQSRWRPYLRPASPRSG
jgi:hypothetical protein